jgi:phage repressor protein C with HTH and peptisase S24 domain
MGRKAKQPARHEAQAREIAAAMAYLGLEMDDDGFTAVAQKIAVRPETIRKAANGYQKASTQLMHAIRTLVTMRQQLNSKEGLDAPDGGLAESGTKKVPIVSFARAGQDTFNYDDLARYMDDSVESVCKDAYCYALLVEGDSMEPKFSPGDVVVVAPNVEPRNGDVVIARLRESGGVLFKVHHRIDGGRKVKLTSYNGELYPPLEYEAREFRFIHPVYAMTRRLRRDK